MEEDSQTTVTKEYVEARVANWKARLQAFFQVIQAWAERNGWKVDGSGTVRMHEELMQNVGVPATDQPTLRLDNDHGYALFKPKALWVVGANGRIDLYTSKGTFIIVDLEDANAAPRWTIFRATQRRDGDPFTPDIIARLV